MPKKKDRRQKEVKLRKNFFPSLVIMTALWGLTASVVYFVDPSRAGAISLFFLLVFLSLLFTFATLFASARRGFLMAFGVTVFVIMRYFGIGNILNLLLLGGLIISVEIYLSRK